MNNFFENIKNEMKIEDDDDNIDSLIDNYENLSENNVNTYFKLPIAYSENKKLLNDTLINDLELKDKTEFNSIYKKLFKPSNEKYSLFDNQIIDQWSNYFTTDKQFLIDNQSLLKIIQNENIDHETNNKYVSSLYDSWLNLKNLKYFNEKYQFISWSILESLNHSSFFLTFLSYYNLSSPIFSLLLPIFLMILPFFILKLRGIEVTFSKYWDILKIVMAQNSIMKLFVNFNNSNLQEKAYSVLSVIFYLIQIYQNIQCCIMFYQNLYNIMNFYKNIKQFIISTKQKMNIILKNNLQTFTNFNSELKTNLDNLNTIENKLNKIVKPDSFVFQINQIGYIMKIYYELYNTPLYHSTFMYSIGFNTYFNHLLNINNYIKNNEINFCSFVSSKKFSHIKNNYYLALISNNPIKNNVSIKKNIMITGPNASGKTTILKSFIINQILSQQIGCGCYDSAKIKCYDFIYSYLNIPDTSGRDSLFQAEARRCKTILDNIISNKDKQHLCIFDELYSGTNPSDAVETAHGFIKYMNKFGNNVRFLITTHYFDLCKKVKGLNVLQKSMKTQNTNNRIKYTYLIQNGINQTKAGKDVLKQMEYPDEITN